jgi:hypothetical protein
MVTKRKKVTDRRVFGNSFSTITVFMLCTTMFCIAKNASKSSNFTHKKEAYGKRQNEGFALPEKERIGQVGASSDNGVYNP